MIPVKICSCGLSYKNEEWEALPLVDPIEHDGEDREVRTCPCGAHLELVIAKVFEPLEDARYLEEIAD
jgi:hypothetical protein